MARSRSSTGPANSSAQLGFEAKLWLTADKLRNNMDAAEYTLEWFGELTPVIPEEEILR